MLYTVTEFLSKMEDEIYSNDESFILNMKDSQYQQLTFCKWLRIFLAWMEWNTDEECEQSYE